VFSGRHMTRGLCLMAGCCALVAAGCAEEPVELVNPSAPYLQGAVWPGDPVTALLQPEEHQTVKVNLLGTVKNAVPVKSRSPVIMEVAEEAGGEFVFSAGVVKGGAPGKAGFRVLAGGRSFAFSVGPDEGWKRFSVPLGRGAGKIKIECGLAGEGAFIANPRFARRDTKRDESRVVAFILIDALRADALGAYGAKQSPSRNIDRLAREGAIFERAYTSSPFTLTSVATIFTGLHPWQHRVLFAKDAGLVMDNSLPSLVSRFRESGYFTAAFSGTYFLMSRNGYAKGFDHFDEVCAPSFFSQSADCLNRRIISWLENRRERGPLFLYVHYVDTHAPYRPPEEYRLPRIEHLPVPGHQDVELGQIEQFGKNRRWWQFFRRPSQQDIEYLKALYRGEVAYVDGKVGELAARLKDYSGGFELILLTADHGEAFYEHGEMDHVAELHDPVMRVPFILSGRNVPSGVSVKTQARTLDMIPTLLDLSGIALPESAAGRSLVPAMKGQSMDPAPAAAMHYIRGKPEYTLVFWPWKLFRRPEDRQAELYRLDLDPGEKEDLSGRGKPQLEEMLRVLDAMLEKGAEYKAAPGEADPEMIKRLRTIGYVED